MMAGYWEFGGGLGDVLNQCYDGGSYHLLDDITSSVDVTLASHNPFASEMFSWHPKRHLMNLRVLPWWAPGEDGLRRSEYGLPPQSRPIGGRPGMTFYRSSADDAALASLPPRFVVVAQGAGMGFRSLDPELTKTLIGRVVATGIPVVLSGRTYDRSGRREDLAGYAADGVFNLIDRLTAPGACELVRRCSAIITCHSSMNIVGWWERKPQLLLYPDEVRVRHFLKKDSWSFGMDFPDTFMATFEDAPGVAAAVENFFAYLPQIAEAKPPPPVPIRDYPAEAERIALNWPGGRFTGDRDVRILLHEASKADGDILEVGCHRGVTTLELAMAFPDRLVYAVDAPWAAVCNQQVWERVRSDEVCDLARHLANVVPVLKTFETLPVEMFSTVGVVFLDGSLSYYELMRDTKIAIDILGKRGGLIAWHDCYDDSPAWVGVPYVVAKRHAENPTGVWRVRHSWSAFEIVRPS